MRSTLRDVLETLLLTLLIFLLVRAVVQNFRVEGRSMEPTLHSGQYLLINKAVYWSVDPHILGNVLAGETENAGENGKFFVFGPPQRGDVVVFHYPRDPERDFIKRVIGVPGDTVEIHNGRVYVNDQIMIEEYTSAAPSYSYPRQVVPRGNYFVLGDNRNNSSDSHIWGLVPVENIVGKAWLSYWPPEEWGFLPDHDFALTRP